MTDRENVIKGLECCLSTDLNDCTPMRCPYFEFCGGHGAPNEILRDALALLKAQEPEDAVPVVRCGDCEHSYFASNRTPDEQCWVCGKHGIDVTPEWYCADGERRDEDEADRC